MEEFFSSLSLFVVAEDIRPEGKLVVLPGVLSISLLLDFLITRGWLICLRESLGINSANPKLFPATKWMSCPESLLAALYLLNYVEDKTTRDAATRRLMHFELIDFLQSLIRQKHVIQIHNHSNFQFKFDCYRDFHYILYMLDFYTFG